MHLEHFLSPIRQWAEQQPDIRGVLLVGSHARHAARPDSDVDLVILTDCPERYVDSIDFAERLGAVSRWQKEDWGRVTSVRVWYEDGLEVEYGFTRPDWACEPLDPGTRRVISDGLDIVFDRDGSLAGLARSASQ